MTDQYCDICGSGTHNQSDHEPIKFYPCGSLRPIRKVLCQLPKNHKGSCMAVVFWECCENIR